METTDRRRLGMTMAELMISMTVLASVIGWVLIAFTDQHHAQLNHERVIEAQHEGRLITDLMVSDLRMAGFMVPKVAGLASADGGPNNPDLICMSDPAVFDGTIVENSNQRFVGAAAAINGGNVVNVNAADLDIDGDGTADFAVGNGIIIADNDNAHCAVITAIGGGDITFQPPTPGGFAVGPPEGIAAPAVHYAINGTELSRNGTALSSSVEDIQIEYWVDLNDDSVMGGAGEFPVHDLNGLDLSQLRLARVSISSRTEIPDLDMPGQGFTAVANRVAGPADNFKRRRQIAETLLRNMR